MKKKLLVTGALAVLALTGCRGAERSHDYASHSDHQRHVAPHHATMRDRDHRHSATRHTNDRVAHHGSDQHYDFVSGLGFQNVVNPNGHTYHHQYRLDQTKASDRDVFHGWRHTWVEPRDYLNKDIDVYRYTGDYQGEARTVHILSHNGRVLGGYHFRDGETAEHAKMIEHNGHFSRLTDDFRTTWDDLFKFRG
ncbi:MAG: hypothetical protein FWG67_09590 [Defluviitaleaceae bacterium]|nr:hypothetical protein [Defluviitaleaceae bacterium]